MELLIKCGVMCEKIYMLDCKGVIYICCDDFNEYKVLFVNNIDKCMLEDVIVGVDLFFGVFGFNLLLVDVFKLMVDKFVVFVCFNLDFEIKLEIVY